MEEEGFGGKSKEDEGSNRKGIIEGEREWSSHYWEHKSSEFRKRESELVCIFFVGGERWTLEIKVVRDMEAKGNVLVASLTDFWTFNGGE